MMEKEIRRKSDAHYLADQQAFTAHFRPQALVKTGVKTVVLSGLLFTIQYIEDQIEEEEEDDDDALRRRRKQSPTKATSSRTDGAGSTDEDHYQEFLSRCSITFVKNVTIATTTRSLEVFSLHLLDVRLAGKLMKSKFYI